MNKQLYESTLKLIGCDKMISCLNICGCRTIEDLRLLKETNIKDLETYVSEICQGMPIEERIKYMGEEFINRPESFIVPPFTKLRLFAAIAQINGKYDCEPQITNSLIDRPQTQQSISLKNFDEIKEEEAFQCFQASQKMQKKKNQRVVHQTLTAQPKLKVQMQETEEQAAERRARNAQRKRQWRKKQQMRETEEQAAERRAHNAQKKRQWRKKQQMLETGEQTVERRAQGKETIRQFRIKRQIKETEEETPERRAKNAPRMQKLRLNRRIQQNEEQAAEHRMASSEFTRKVTVQDKAVKARKKIRKETNINT